MFVAEISFFPDGMPHIPFAIRNSRMPIHLKGHFDQELLRLERLEVRYMKIVQKVLRNIPYTYPDSPFFLWNARLFACQGLLFDMLNLCQIIS